MMMLIFGDYADICDDDNKDIEAVDDFHGPELLLYKIKFQLCFLINILGRSGSGSEIFDRLPDSGPKRDGDQ